MIRERRSRSNVYRKDSSFIAILILSNLIASGHGFFPNTQIIDTSRTFTTPAPSNGSSSSLVNNFLPQNSHSHPKTRPLSLSSSPDANELAQQKYDTIQSFSDYNDGVWKGKATAYSVTSDVAAGVSKQITLECYHTSVQTSLDGDGLSMMETISWDDKVSSRKVRLSESMDVDSVDGSYSMDETISNIPSALLGTSELIKFSMEHSLAVSDDHRVRLLVLYDQEDVLLRLIVCEEERLEKTKSDFGSVSEEEEGLEMDQLVSKITGGDVPSTPKKEITSATSTQDRMDLLLQAMDNKKARDNSKIIDTSTNNVSIDRNPMTLFGLVSGVWLGDMVVRNHPTTTSKSTKSTKPSKGFGAPSTKASQSLPKPGSGQKDGFAEWDTGVQKIAMTFRWDYATQVRQRMDVGRSMGVGLSDQFPKLSGGNVITSDMARGKDPEERLVCIDWDYGAYLGLMVGSIMIKVSVSINSIISSCFSL